MGDGARRKYESELGGKKGLSVWEKIFLF